MNTDNIIIVPTDFSEVCDNAIHHGAELAKHMNYKLTLLHVIDKTTKSDLKKENLGFESVDQKLSVIAEKYKKGNQLEINYISREGNIFDTISTVAEEIHAEIMILGTHGKVGIQQITGSYAYKVVTTAPCPTIIVQKRSFGEGYNNIVFPIEEIDYVRQKVQWTIKVAKTFDATIHLYIVETKSDELNYKLKLVITQIEQIFNEHKVRFVIKYADKATSFTNQVLNYAGEIRADLIMIMSKKDVFDFIYSPAEERLIFNHAQIPVLCVNPRELYMYRMSI